MEKKNEKYPRVRFPIPSNVKFSSCIINRIELEINKYIVCSRYDEIYFGRRRESVSTRVVVIIIIIRIGCHFEKRIPRIVVKRIRFLGEFHASHRSFYRSPRILISREQYAICVICARHRFLRFA